MRVIQNKETSDHIAENRAGLSCLDKGSDTDEPSITTALTHPNPTTQLLLTSKPLIHRADAGVNPLVDAAAYLFSIIGKLKRIKSYKSLKKLHAELMQEVENFQETVQTYNYEASYLAEYLPLSCYILCLTLDEVIASTSWGGQGKWDKYSLVNSFNQEPLSHENFLIILERLVRDPAIYVDVMEFIYICMSLGFKCRYQAVEFNYEQLEQITNSLYKHIRLHRGNFNKILSPFPIKSSPPSRPSYWEKLPVWSVIALSSIFFAIVVLSGNIFLDKTFGQLHKKLNQMELTTYERH